MKLRLSELAARDIKDVLSVTARDFGPRQVLAYAKIIEAGITLVVGDPYRVGSQDRSEIRPNIRQFHLELAAKRRGAASHCLYYTVSDKDGELVVLRVLHEHMEPRRRVIRSLSSE